MKKRQYRITLCFITVILFTGCTTLLVGGAGVGGYAVGTDERPIGVISSDLSLTAKVKATLIKDSKIDAFDINVDTYRGIVSLHGHVKSSAEQSRAVRLASSIKGVKRVVSALLIIK